MPVRQLKSETFTNLVTALKERTALDAVKKDATNEFNRKNTVAANLFKKLLSENDFPAGTAVEIDGTKFTWAVSEGREIDPREWYKLWQDGEITEDQYFECLAVGKTDAKLVIGEDQVETISIDTKGSKADIRVDATEAGTRKGNQVVTPTPIQKPTGVRPRPGAAAPQVSVQAPARKIRIPAAR